MPNRLLPSLLLLFALAGTAAAAPSCPTVPVQYLRLPHLRAAIHQGQPVVIAAIGSSSTWGAMAQDIGDSYPAMLQDDLGDRLPDSEISVINRGIGGEDALREDRRMERDVLALRPTLVIWQVGANAAMRGESPDTFTSLVEQGLRRLRAANLDVVLMDNQRSRRLLRSPDNARINAALAHLARRYRVGLFSRDVLMRAWARAGADLSGFLAPDGMHMNDRGYACTAAALADSIVAAVK
jgi:lysophospholipase L1-like esterase